MQNAAERKDIRKAEKAAALAERDRVEFVTAAMSTRQGRAWFHAFLTDCRCFNDPFSGDALLEAYTKGRREMGLRVYHDIVQNCPDDFVVMMKEAAIKEYTDAQRPADPADSGESDSDDSDYDIYSEPKSSAPE